MLNLYLSSYDYDEFAKPRKILQYQKEKFSGRNILIVDVDTPVIGQTYGFGGNEISRLYLINRVNENAFDQLNQFPIDVHILIVKKLAVLPPSSISELQSIAWGCLYDNEREAHSFKP
ncbi:hypothetical protein JWG44_20125 [Leptospira sp. 201903071]|uniref:hypothetical protein n=1 Tax=Leptospira ainazelensis TaxID=2810034 RepID=UPI0019628989|nr:hypothetical protein [Leptospira ainazelensis]MBM9502565.1 hypothetical protein [Leptospira ainazelensis]